MADKPIRSLNDLAWRLGMPLPRLRKIAVDIQRDMYSHYSYEVKHLLGGKDRHLRVPKPELRKVQKRIHRNILRPLSLSHAAHGGVKGCSPRTNASQHLGQRRVINVDVQEFFPSVSHRQIYGTFRRFDFGSDVASLLTRLTTVSGQLPQGSPTSTALANLLLAGPVDDQLAREAQALGARYTRYVDDMTFSGRDPRPLINMARTHLARKGLRLHRSKQSGKSKLTIALRSERQEVTGLVVNSDRPSLSRQRRDKIRATIHSLRTKAGADARKLENSIRGKLVHLAEFNPGAAKRLRRLFDGVIS